MRKLLLLLNLSISNLERIFLMGESGLFSSLLIMCMLLTILSPYFLTVNNLLNIIRQISVIGIIFSGMTFAYDSVETENKNKEVLEYQFVTIS